MLGFTAQSDGVERSVKQYDLASLMQENDVELVDLALVDIQGWELLFLQQPLPLLRSGRVRFLVVSTHHHSISGNALVHQQGRRAADGGGRPCDRRAHGLGVREEGRLIAVSFDERDRDLVVPVSHVRARDSLFGELELEHDLAAAQLSAPTVRDQMEASERELAGARQSLDRTGAKSGGVSARDR